MQRTKSPSKQMHQLVKDDLLRRLGSQWCVGDWLPSVRELSRELSAGHVSTHRAIVELASEGYLLSLRGKGTRVMRTPVKVAGPNARAADGRTHVAIFRAGDTDDMVHRMIEAFIESTCSLDVEYSFHLLGVRYDEIRLNRRVDVAVMFNPSLVVGPSRIPEMADHIIAVSTAASADTVFWPRYDVVTVDEEQGGYLAGRCLREAGCATACFIGRGINVVEYDAPSLARLRGFEAGWGEAIPEEYRAFGYAYSEKTGKRAMRLTMTLDPRPDGIFAASDDLAIGVIAKAVHQGWKPGTDFQLVGFDGQRRSLNATGYALTSIEIPAAAMGRHAGRLLRQRMVENESLPTRIVLPCALRAGETARSGQMPAAANMPQASTEEIQSHQS